MLPYYFLSPWLFSIDFWTWINQDAEQSFVSWQFCQETNPPAATMIRLPDMDHWCAVGANLIIAALNQVSHPDIEILIEGVEGVMVEGWDMAEGEPIQSGCWTRSKDWSRIYFKEMMSWYCKIWIFSLIFMEISSKVIPLSQWKNLAYLSHYRSGGLRYMLGQGAHNCCTVTKREETCNNNWGDADLAACVTYL